MVWVKIGYGKSLAEKKKPMSDDILKELLIPSKKSDPFENSVLKIGRKN
jgi:hypothetical protein